MYLEVALSEVRGGMSTQNDDDCMGYIFIFERDTKLLLRALHIVGKHKSMRVADGTNS